MSNAISAPANLSISLYFSDGRSDKEYHVQLEEKDAGYVVNFQYGRRGSTLQTGRKTATPVLFSQAVKIYDKLVAEKTSKGYSPGASGTAYQDTQYADRFTGLLPQLLNPIEESELATFLINDEFVLQEKMDGERRLIRFDGKSTLGINRRGLRVPLPESLTRIPETIGSFTLDGEAIGERFYAFDLLEKQGEDLCGLEFWDRFERLKHLVATIGLSNLLIVPFVEGAQDKESTFQRIKALGKEGIVLKTLTSPYIPGRPASGGSWLKFKFTATISVLVRGITPGKRSVLLGLFKGEEMVEIGNVTIPVNHDIPKIGEIVEVQYLYAHPNGSLFQPVFLGRRSDLVPSDCSNGQLKFKSSSDTEE